MLEDLRDYGIVYQRKVPARSVYRKGVATDLWPVESIETILPYQTSYYIDIRQCGIGGCSK